MPARLMKRIAIVGFGEVGGIFGNDLAKQGIEVSVFDILFDSPNQRQQMFAKAGTCGVKAAENLEECLRDAELVISAVTASSAAAVAEDAGPLLRVGQTFLDINSVSPETKRTLAAQIGRGQAHFAEAAVMTAVAAPRLKVPMLLGGQHAVETAERLRSVGMNATPLSERVGVASAVKMCRSVIIKGLEALTVECLFAARQYGAEDAVLESLAATYPSLGWKDQLPDYLISRVAQHGIRRSAEMREVAQAVEAVGIEPKMALAVAERQERLVLEMREKGVGFEEKTSFSWRPLADAIGGRQPGSLRVSQRENRP